MIRPRQVPVPPRPLAIALALALCVGAFVYASKSGGGSDSYGYLSQSELFLRGLPRFDQMFARGLPWPQPRATFMPYGYRSETGPGSGVVVPTYPPGLPLLLAGAKKTAGESAKFWVIPLCAGLLVLCAFTIGRRLASDAAGLAAAWLVATSPQVLSSAMQTMSDVPASAFWALAFVFVLGESVPAATASGLAAGLAILIRPNLAPLAAVLACRFAAAVISGPDRRAWLVRGSAFGLGAAAGVGALLALNRAIYGRAFESGYGDLDGLFLAANILPNLRRYPVWIVETQSAAALAGVAALFVPLANLWPASGARGRVLLAAGMTAAVWTIYLLYMPFDVWWYLRLLLPTWPFMMAGTGALAVWIARARPSVLGPLVVAGVVALGGWQLHRAYQFGVFETWMWERRFITAGLIAQRLTVPNSVIISGQHSGSLRYYGGRMTMRYDQMDPAYIDVAVDWLRTHGVHVYLFVEDWELRDIDTLFDKTRTMDAIETSALAHYLEPGEMWLFDISHPRRVGDPTEVITGVERGLTMPGPAPVPQLVFR